MARFEQRMNIDAPVDKVWEIMINPATWEQWFPDIDSLSGLGAVRVLRRSWPGSCYAERERLSPLYSLFFELPQIVRAEAQATRQRST